MVNLFGSNGKQFKVKRSERETSIKRQALDEALGKGLITKKEHKEANDIISLNILAALFRKDED